MNHILTEKELEKVFSGKKKIEQVNVLLKYFKPASIFVSILISSFLLLNINGIKENVFYWYESIYGQPETATSDQSVTIAEQLLKENTSEQKKLPPLPQIPNNSIRIPSLDISAPITWNVVNEPESVKNSLINGVAQIKGTSLPGEEGNVFITGHSSNYPWVKSDYNSIFALISKLVVGDALHVKYNNQDYLYRVYDSKVVKPTDTSVMSRTKTPELTLMTCTPVGTNLRRLIISAKQIYPDPGFNSTRTNTTQNQKLPQKVR